MLNFCGIVMVILKMATGRNFSMSGINSGHHYLPHVKFWWYRTMLNFCSIVVAILKMVTSRNCSMSGINSGHHYLPTYQIVMISNNVEFLWYILKIATGRNCSMSGLNLGHHYLPTFQIVMISDNVEFFTPYFGSHFENGRHLENFENAHLLL